MVSVDCNSVENEYIQEFERFDKMRDEEKEFEGLRDEYEESDEKDAFDLDIEIPVDEYEMHTPERRKDSDDDLLL